MYDNSALDRHYILGMGIVYILLIPIRYRYCLSIPIRSRYCLSIPVLIDTVINTIWCKNILFEKLLKMLSYFITAELLQLC